MEENENLRAQCARLKKVQITGPDGTVVYAQGQFDDDGQEHGNINLWRVKLQEVTPCPLTELGRAEFRIGGTLLYSLERAEREIINDEFGTREEDGDLLLLSYGSDTPFATWVNLEVAGKPREAWEEQIVEWAIDGHEGLSIPLLSFHGEGLNVSFPEVSIWKEGVQELMDLVPHNRKLVGEDHELAVDFQEFLFQVMTRMRAAGSQEFGRSFLGDATHIIEALMFHRIVRIDQEGAEELVNALAVLQLGLKEQDRQSEFPEVARSGEAAEVIETIRGMGFTV